MSWINIMQAKKRKIDGLQSIEELTKKKEIDIIKFKEKLSQKTLKNLV